VGPWQILDHRSQKPEPSRRADILFVAADHTPGFYEELLPIVQPQIVVPNHWDDFLRPLSKPIRPMLRMPKWGIPPLQRIQLAEFQQAIERAYPQAIVLIPKIFQPYQLDDFSTLSPRH
jgi:hypothetical protein